MYSVGVMEVEGTRLCSSKMNGIFVELKKK